MLRFRGFAVGIFQQITNIHFLDTSICFSFVLFLVQDIVRTIRTTVLIGSTAFAGTSVDVNAVLIIRTCRSKMTLLVTDEAGGKWKRFVAAFLSFRALSQRVFRRATFVANGGSKLGAVLLFVVVDCLAGVGTMLYRMSLATTVKTHHVFAL